MVEPEKIPAQEAHLHEFFDCMRSRKTSSCDMHQAFGEDISCHLGTMAYREGRRIRWDPVQFRAV